MAKNNTPVRLSYNKHEPEGCSNSTPVIFLHGLSVSKEHWGNLPQNIANKTKRKVYVLDARNHGDSEWSDEFSFDMNVDDLLHFMDTVGENKAILVGHSMGGITAMKTALKRPERIEKIIVEDMYAKTLPSDSLKILYIYMGYLQKVVQNIPPELDEEKAKMFCVEEFPRVLPKELQDYAEKHTGKVKPRYFFALKRDSNGRYANKANFDALIEAIKKKDTLQSELTGRYDGPAHFIYGKLSIMNVPDDVDNIKQLFPKAELTGIENATHNVHDDSPEEFTTAILKSLL